MERVGKWLAAWKGVDSFSLSPLLPSIGYNKVEVPGQTGRDYKGRRVAGVDGGF